MRNKIENNIYAFMVCAFLIGAQSCKEETLLFPQQIEAEKEPESDRGPVKQKDLKVIIEEDRAVKFDLSSVDTDRVKSLFFAYNPNGDLEETKVTDFESLYVIKNISVIENTSIEVWAEDKDGNLSKKHAYVVKALPYAVEKVVNSIKFAVENMSAYLDVINLSTSEVTLFYKIDDAVSFTELVLPISSVNKEIWFKKLSIGEHVIQYYAKDGNGQEVDVMEHRFEIVQPPIVEFATAAQKSKWTVSVNANHDGDGDGGPGLIDGNVETFWHTPWSGEIPPWPFEATIGFNEDLVLTGLILNIRHNNGSGGPKDFDLQTSEDGITYTTVQSFTNTSTTAREEVTFNLTTPLATRYVRLSFKNGFNASYMNLGEISFIGYSTE